MGRGRLPTRIIRDPIEAEFFAEDQDLAREARRLRLKELIARREVKLEEIKNNGEPEKEISYAGVNVGNEILKGILEVAMVDPVRAKAILDSYSIEDIAKMSAFSSGGSGGNPLAMLPFIKSDETTLHDIVEIMEMMRPAPKPQKISNEEEIVMLMKVLAETDKVQAENVQN